MSVSQNAVFTGAAPDDPELDHPPGAGLARMLSAAIAAGGWGVDELDDWRDSGWQVRCRRGGADVDVVVAAAREGEWFLQIAPHDAPGALARLFGKKSASAGVEHVLELSQLAHAALVAGGFRDLRWRWNGDPSADQATPVPAALDSAR